MYYKNKLETKLIFNFKTCLYFFLKNMSLHDLAKSLQGLCNFAKN
jgi:hypothetical protein